MLRHEVFLRREVLTVCLILLLHLAPLTLLQEQRHRRALARVYQQQREKMMLLSHNGNDFVPAAPRSWIKRYIAWPNREPVGFDSTYPRLTIGRGL